jgi:hypothetical protein
MPWACGDSRRITPICSSWASESRVGLPGLSPSTNPDNPSALKRSTQYSTVRVPSPRNCATFGARIPCATNRHRATCGRSGLLQNAVSHLAKPITFPRRRQSFLHAYAKLIQTSTHAQLFMTLSIGKSARENVLCSTCQFWHLPTEQVDYHLYQPFESRHLAERT